MKTLAKLALVTGMLAFATPAIALTATQTVQKEVITTAVDGTETISYESAETVVPGERVVYTLNYANDKVEPASNLVLTMPVPEVVTFIEETATGGNAMTYSADGGQNFSSRIDLMVKMENGDMRPAGADDITHIRWNIDGPVAPGETGALAFSGLLK